MNAVNETCPSGKPVSDNVVTQHGEHIVGFCSTEHRDHLEAAADNFAKSTRPAVATRSFNNTRSGANTQETISPLPRCAAAAFGGFLACQCPTTRAAAKPSR